MFDMYARNVATRKEIDLMFLEEEDGCTLLEDGHEEYRYDKSTKSLWRSTERGEVKLRGQWDLRDL